MKGPNVPRNPFDLSHDRKMSMDMGKLVPFLCEEVLPGDYFRGRSSLVVRITPLLAPLMHKVDVFTHFFFVPNRLVWTNFEKFITGGTDGLDSTVWPYIEKDVISVETLMDYFGLPLYNHAGGAKVRFSALPIRAYGLLCNEWYLDQTLQTPVTISKADGADTTTSVSLLNRCWEKDYFTSALPWPQRGAAVSLPLGTTAPVKGIGKVTSNFDTGPAAFRETGGASRNYAHYKMIDADASNNQFGVESDGNDYPNIFADLTNASSATINALRQAFRVQKFLERNARGGARYVESILAHFGVRSSDARLQRPEFLGGGRSPITVSEVLQTSESGTTPQGTMAGHAFSYQSAHSFEKSFEEHGFLIGIVSVMPRTGYMQGLHRMWSRASKYDYYWPEFANLGEQAVLSKEVYCDPFVGGDDDVFGYQGRYDEFRRRESSSHGKFRTSLDYWHMDRKFTSRPTLSAAFVESDPTKRINAVTTEPNVLLHVHHDIMAVRPIPVEGIPGGV